jgi:DNA-binding Lrp family transcriptional regulator
MDKIDKDILRRLAGNIDSGLEPFKPLATSLKISEDELLSRLEDMHQRGYLKRIAPILYHHKTAYKYNALTAWNIPADKVDFFADILMSIEGISHVYERERCDNWPYNMYGMLHALDEPTVHDIVGKLAKLSNGAPHKVIYTTKEWKKTSPNLEYLLK